MSNEPTLFVFLMGTMFGVLAPIFAMVDPPSGIASGVMAVVMFGLGISFLLSERKRASRG